MSTSVADDQCCPHCGKNRLAEVKKAESSDAPQKKETHRDAVAQATKATQYSDQDDGTSSESTDSSLRPIYAAEGSRRRRLMRRRREIARLWG